MVEFANKYNYSCHITKKNHLANSKLASLKEINVSLQNLIKDSENFLIFLNNDKSYIDKITNFLEDITNKSNELRLKKRQILDENIEINNVVKVVKEVDLNIKLNKALSDLSDRIKFY